MLPLAGLAAGVTPAGAGPGVLPRAGSGRADFWALAGTANGVRGLLSPGRGEAPPGRWWGGGTTPGEEDGGAAMPGLGVAFRFIFSA